ncbi:hypothetical protein AHiyo8_21440 [Arthrobacter sp. Hiyo8]|nr:hypothetical protein AHiyo8_21440 [Arthrobacter sp. Hiyo8]
MPADGVAECFALGVAAGCHEVVRTEGVVNFYHLLGDDRSLIQLTVDVVRGGTHGLDAPA